MLRVLLTVVWEKSTAGSLVAIFSFLLSAFAAQAGDLAQFQPIGFSRSGQYYAFAQFGIHDGSSIPYAEASVIDVAKNEMVATNAVELPEKKDGTFDPPEQALQKVIAAAKLNRFSIVKDETPGRDFLIHLPTDYSSISSNVFSLEARSEGGASGTVPKYEVRVETTKTEPADKDTPPDFGPAQLLRLSIVGRENTDGTVKILQDDKVLPKKRPYPLAYTVRRVTGYKGGIVIVISYTTPGFEGPDVRYMVVSGKMPATEE